MLVGGKWFWCCKDNIIFPLRHHRTARVFPTPRAFSVRPPHSARWAAPNCTLLPYLFTSSAPSSAFSCFSPPLFGTKRRTSGTFAPRPAHPPCAIRCIFPPHLRLATGVKRTSSIYSCTTSSDAGGPFLLPLSQGPVISHHHAPLASSSRLLRFQTSPSTRPIPPHTSVFSGSFIHNYPLPQVVNPTFLPTYRRHIFET